MIPSKLPTPLEVIAPLMRQVECGYRPVRHCCGPTFGMFVDGKCATCGRSVHDNTEEIQPVRHVEPPIDAQDKVRKKLIALRIEQKELEELLALNKSLQLQYEAKILPF